MIKNYIVTLSIIITLLVPAHAQNMHEGITLLRNEKTIKAKEYFYSMVNSQHTSSAMFYLGDICLAEGKNDSAKIYFESGIKADPENPLNYAGLAKYYYILSQPLAAAPYEKSALEFSEADKPDILCILAESFTSEGSKNFDKVFELLNDALAINPNHERALLLQGQIYLSGGKGTESLRCFERVLTVNPKNPEARLMKAGIYKLITKSGEAIILLQEAIASDPAYSPAYRELAEIYAESKDYSSAALYYEKYIQYSESSYEKAKRLASLLYLNKEYNKSAALLKDLLTGTPKDQPLLRIIAYSYLRQDSVEMSKRYFKQMFSNTAAEFQISDFENYAELLIKSGEEQTALPYLRKVIELDSTRKDMWGKISVINFKNKNWDGVISTLTAKGTLTSQEYFDISKAYIFRGDANITRVLQFTTESVKPEPEQIDKVRLLLLRYQAQLCAADGSSEKISLAKTELTAAVEQVFTSQQKSVWAQIKTSWNTRIDTSIGTEYMHADTMLSMLLAKSPNLVIAYLWKARVKVNFDPETEIGLAQPYYDLFIEKSAVDKNKFKKELIEAYSYLGYYYYLKNDAQKSKANWAEVAVLDPSNKQAVEALKVIK